jgi:hypothetical protein
MSLAMTGVAPAETGLASGLVNTTGEVGAAIGLAVLATLSATRADGLLAQGVDPAVAATEGYHVGFWAAAGLVVLAILIAVTVLRPERQAGHELAVEPILAPEPEPVC